MSDEVVHIVLLANRKWKQISH